MNPDPRLVLAAGLTAVPDRRIERFAEPPKPSRLPIVRMACAIDGNVFAGVQKERYSRQPTKRLGDGTVGYFVRPPRTDDCLAAALATVLQVPIDQVPDPCIDDRLRAGDDPEEIDRSAHAELADWLTRRGLRMVCHRKLPAPRRRWIGVVPQAGWFMSHSLVMSGDQVLFDPAREFGYPMRRFGLADVAFGLSFQADSKGGPLT